MVLPKALSVVLLLYSAGFGESRTHENDPSSEKKIVLAPLGQKHEVNQIASDIVRQTRGGAGSKVQPSPSSYSSEVSNLFKAMFPSDDTCLKIARGKSADFSKNTQDIQMAVQLVNIYTQDCTIYLNSVGKPFYATLNENLRSGNPQRIWQETGKLLNEGLVLLGHQTFPNLYRGCHCNDVQKGRPFTFLQFASTTANPGVALQFLLAPPGKSFIRIINAKGTGIEPYSFFQNEKEILLPPDVNLVVIQVETDINRIREEIKKIVPSQVIPDDTVKMFVLLDGSRTKPKGGLFSSCICGGNP